MGDVFPSRSNASLRRLGPSSSSAMKIDSSGEDDQLMSPALALPPPPAGPAPSRKRKKTDDTGASGEGGTGNGGGGEPRRLRRSHEACARCRAKKIKVSSSYPSSTLPRRPASPVGLCRANWLAASPPPKIINQKFYMLLRRNLQPESPSSPATVLTTRFFSATPSIHDAVPALLRALSANKRIAIGTCIILGLHERWFNEYTFAGTLSCPVGTWNA
jgi:hypothetical protein